MKRKVFSCPLINDSSLVQVSVFSLFGGVVRLHLSLPLALSLSHVHTQRLSVVRSIWHPQGRQSVILGPTHYWACSTYPPPPPPLPQLPVERQLCLQLLSVLINIPSKEKLKWNLNEMNHKRSWKGYLWLCVSVRQSNLQYRYGTDWNVSVARQD